MRRLWVTGVVWVLTAAMAVWQTVDPAVLDALRRDPSFAARGEWWRVLSPLLVQSDGWPQIVTNLVFLAVIGYFAERCFGPLRWLLLYLTGGIAGEVVGYAFEPHGAGSSVAIFGLVGGLLAAAARDRRSMSPVPVVASLAWIASIVGLDLGGYVWAAVGSSLVVVFATQVARRVADPTRLYLPAAVLAAALAVLLVALADDHGLPILAGLSLCLSLRPSLRLSLRLSRRLSLRLSLRLSRRPSLRRNFGEVVDSRAVFATTSPKLSLPTTRKA